MSELFTTYISAMSTGMAVLMSWSVMNIMLGSIGMYLTSKTKNFFYFYQMNLFWNIVNLVVGFFGMVYTESFYRETVSVGYVVDTISWFQTLLALNIPMNLVYATIGSILLYFMKRHPSQRMQEYGYAIVLQAFFLFLFDTTMFAYSFVTLQEVIGRM